MYNSNLHSLRSYEQYDSKMKYNNSLEEHKLTDDKYSVMDI